MSLYEGIDTDESDTDVDCLEQLEISDSELEYSSEYPLPTNFKVSTKTMLCDTLADLGITFDICIIATFMELTEHITGLKYGYMQKGSATRKTKKRKNNKIRLKFLNQVTIHVKPNLKVNKVINIKIFKNGKLQMTGCKDDTDVLNSIIILFKHLIQVFGTCLIPVKIKRTLIYSDVCCRFYNTNGDNIGYIDEKRRMYIYDREAEIIDNTIVDLEYIDLQKNIYDLNGKKIGEKKIILSDNSLKDLVFTNKNDNLHSKIKTKTGTNKRLKLFIKTITVYSCFRNKETWKCECCKNDFDRFKEKHPNKLTEFEELCKYSPRIIFDKSNKKVGEEITIFTSNNTILVQQLPKSKKIIAEYHAVKSNHSELTNIINNPSLLQFRTGMINANFESNFKIKRDKLTSIASNYTSRIVEFDSNIYPGVKIYYYPKSQEHKCICRKKICKCKIYIGVFQNGNIIMTTKSLEHTHETYNFINNILKTHYQQLLRIPFE